MRKAFIAILVCALAAIFAPAQNDKSEQAKVWKQFQTAISRKDKRAVAALIEFPFEASIIGDDYDFKVETPEDLIENFDRVFTASRRSKIIRGKFVGGSEAGEFNFELRENGAYHVFTFRKIKGKYKLVATMAAG